MGLFYKKTKIVVPLKTPAHFKPLRPLPELELEVEDGKVSFDEHQDLDCFAAPMGLLAMTAGKKLNEQGL